MAVENDSEQTSDNEQLPFGKGTRVRVHEGDAEGAIGEIVWWGKSRWGPQMRAGVQTEGEESEKIWVDASALRAIDEKGDDLDPQPFIERTADPADVETRGINIAYALAQTMTAVRLQRGYPESKATSATLRLDRLKQAEEELGCSIPDPVIAYVASGLGTIRKVGDIARLTVELCEQLEKDEAVEKASFLAFDRDDGDFLAFKRGDKEETDTVMLFRQDEGYESETVELMDHLTDQLEKKRSQRNEPFQVLVDYITTDQSEPAPDEQWVTHAKFGRGMVLASEATMKGEKLTIRFEGGNVVKLLDRFIEYD